VRRSLGSLVAGAAIAALVVVLVVGAAEGKGPPPEPASSPPAGVTAQGTAIADVGATSRDTEGRIRRSVAAAQAQATPRAFQAAKARAQQLAQAAGMTLGDVTAVRPSAQPYWSTDIIGTFGANRFCGRVRRFAGYRTTPSGRRVRRYVMRHGCRAPSDVTVTLEVTFAPAG
jgi:hypothetical protein